VIISEKILSDIIDEQEMSMKCFIHRKTFEVVCYPDEDLVAELFDDDEIWEPLIKKVKKHPKEYLEVPRMTSSESFMIMEDFAEQMENRAMKIKLLQALDGKKPFSRFNHFIHNSDVKDNWFEFKKRRKLDWLRHELELVE
jgi:hypothetical protein